MDVPHRNRGQLGYGYNRQLNDQEHCQVPNRILRGDRNGMSSVGQNQVHVDIQNNPTTSYEQQWKSLLPYPSSVHSGGDRFKGTGVHSNSRQNFDRYDWPTADDAFTSQNYQADCALVVKQRLDPSDCQKVSHFRTVNYAGTDLHNKRVNSSNYINPRLVQKVLECQQKQKRSQTPVVHLRDYDREVPNSGLPSALPSAGQSCIRIQKPEHHLSDVSLCYKMADFHIDEPDAVSTGSQKESGYQSGESVGDHSSATSDNVDQNQAACWMAAPSVTPLGPAPLGTAGMQCEYLVRGDVFIDRYNEQEQLGNLDQALFYLNQAIDCFQHAMNASSTSLEDVLRIRMKHNKAILCQRRLLKQTEHRTGTSRRLPSLPADDCKISSAAMNPSGRHTTTNKYSRVGMDYNDIQSRFAAEKPTYQKDNFNDFSWDVGNINLPSSHHYHQETEAQWTADDVKDIKLYATLPKKKKGQVVMETSASMESVLQSQDPLQSRNPPGSGGRWQPASGYYENTGMIQRPERLTADQKFQLCSNRQKSYDSQFFDL